MSLRDDIPPVVEALVEVWLSGNGGHHVPDLAAGAAAFGCERLRPVLESVHLAPPGTPVPGGVLSVGLLRRRPNLSRPEFGEHWNARHAPLVVSMGPRFHGYVTNVFTDRHADGFWDGVVEQWYPSRAARDAHISETNTGKAEIIADIARFLDYVQLYETEDCEWSLS